MKQIYLMMLAATFAATPAFAQSLTFSPKESGEPVEVTSENGMELHQDTRRVIARGNAKAVQGAVSVTADELIADYRTRADGGNEVYRVFAAGDVPGPMVFKGVRLGVMICEDMWQPDCAECLVESGAEMLIVPNSSPFETDKLDQRLNYAVARVRETELPLVYVNQIGGQDELVFDGQLRICWGGGPVSRLLPSGDVLAPKVEALASDLLDGPSREEVRKRVATF